MEAALSMVEGGRGVELLMEATSSLVKRQIYCVFCLLHHSDPIGLFCHKSTSVLLHVHPSPQACANKCVFCWRHHSNPINLPCPPYDPPPPP